MFLDTLSKAGTSTISIPISVLQDGTGNIVSTIGVGIPGSAIPYLDMGGASLKMNDDGSFNLLVGATDLGTGSDTVLGQMAAEVLGVPLEDILVYSSDTDFTPFDVGAYASSTTYISGAAVATHRSRLCVGARAQSTSGSGDPRGGARLR